MASDRAAPDDRGRAADSPTQVPAKGWKDVLARVRAESKDDHVTLLGAGVAFYGMLALIPGLIALLSLYGLVAETSTVERQVNDALSGAPEEVQAVMSAQMSDIAANSSGRALLAIVIGTVAALWSASAGIGHLMAAINIAYDERETRSFTRRRGVALLLTLGTVVFVALSFTLVAWLPTVLDELPGPTKLMINIARWVVLAPGAMLGLAIVYRLAPDRDDPKWRWATPGAILAAVVWLIGSIALSVYSANIGKFNETYGSLGAVVVLMIWLLIGGIGIIFGAELNAELERQTTQDSTHGAPQPMGSREAYAADTLGPTAEEVERDGDSKVPARSLGGTNPP